MAIFTFAWFWAVFRGFLIQFYIFLILVFSTDIASSNTTLDTLTCIFEEILCLFPKHPLWILKLPNCWGELKESTKILCGKSYRVIQLENVLSPIKFKYEVHLGPPNNGHNKDKTKTKTQVPALALNLRVKVNI